MAVYGNVLETYYPLMEVNSFDTMIESIDLSIVNEGFNISDIKNKIKDLFGKFIKFLKEVKKKIGIFIKKFFDAISRAINDLNKKDTEAEDYIKRSNIDLDNIFTKGKDEYIYEYKEYIDLISIYTLSSIGIYRALREIEHRDFDREYLYTTKKEWNINITDLKNEIFENSINNDREFFDGCKNFTDVRNKIIKEINPDNAKIKEIKITNFSGLFGNKRHTINRIKSNADFARKMAKEHESDIDKDIKNATNAYNSLMKKLDNIINDNSYTDEAIDSAIQEKKLLISVFNTCISSSKTIVNLNNLIISRNSKLLSLAIKEEYKYRQELAKYFGVDIEYTDDEEKKEFEYETDPNIVDMEVD